LENLAWGFAKDNSADAVRNGGVLRGAKKRRQLTGEEVQILRESWNGLRGQSGNLLQLTRELGLRYKAAWYAVRGFSYREHETPAPR
jgi:hypothetical protein